MLRRIWNAITGTTNTVTKPELCRWCTLIRGNPEEQTIGKLKFPANICDDCRDEWCGLCQDKVARGQL